LFSEETLQSYNRVGGVMAGVIGSSSLDRGFEPRLGQAKYY
jgi:hypothetical protein